ncbi:hypothetical protein ABAC460_23170 [Asticcacaulis sp. AC460]|uniref:MFS transporter n=1 Tax=Asticcacaulis sp. AC460 TaxID=1282360 RepID=UPI0003C3E834|nr:MFS transporter [Asticcacaulis sp. AC460]ESQ86505.1 hypothetical protein ABAC460_23170 [Asticcacaulis sp. AC460]
MTKSNLALTGLGLSVLVTSLATSTASIALPVLSQAFAASFQHVQWVVLAYLLGLTTVIIAAGKLGDRLGRRKLLLTGIVVFTLASAACAAAPSLTLLVTARAVQGVGAAVMMALSLAFVGDIVPKAKTGSAMGLLGTLSAVGTALGPSLGGMLIAGFGWPAIFLIQVPVAVIAGGLVWRGVAADRPSTEQAGFDLAGTIVLAVTLAAYALGVTQGQGRLGAVNLALLIFAAAGLALFVRIETRVSSPLVQLGLFRLPGLSAGLAMNALVAAVMMTTLVIGPFYLIHALGLKAATTGLALSIGPVVTALTGIPAGRLADRYGAMTMSRIGLAVMVAGAGLMVLLPGLTGYLAPLAVLTVGYGLFQAANTTAVMTSAAADNRGVMSGLVNLSRNFGLVTGASAMGAIFALASGGATGPDAVSTGLRVTLAVAVGLILTALALSLYPASKDLTHAAD